MRRHTGTGGAAGGTKSGKDSTEYSPIAGSDYSTTRAGTRSQTQYQQAPWKSIGLALLLFFLGATLLVIGGFIFSGHISSRFDDRKWPLMIFGTLMFIPGSYYTHIALRVSLGHFGYSLDDIPQFE